MSTLDEHARAGIQAINEGRVGDAIESFQKAYELAPDRPDLNNALGMAYLHRGEAGTAIPYLKKAVELAEPFDDEEHGEMKVHFRTGLAKAYQVYDQVAEARQTLEQTASRYPDALEPRMQLGQLLLTACAVREGLAIYDELATASGLDDEQKKAAEAIAAAARAFLEAEESARVFLEAHQASYVQYFNEIASQNPDWYTEAARMAKGEDGEVKPILVEGARPYAMSRADLVDPETGKVGSVYSDREPMIVAVEGLEPLAQVPIQFPWKDWDFDVWVCSTSPWHWLTITIQLEDALDEDARIELVDGTMGAWYLEGYNGDYGSADAGRFHFISDPVPVGERGVSYTVDLGRAAVESVDALLRKLTVLHGSRPIRRVLFGPGHLPD